MGITIDYYHDYYHLPSNGGRNGKGRKWEGKNGRGNKKWDNFVGNQKKSCCFLLFLL
jgi:hypothetical protein